MVEEDCRQHRISPGTLLILQPLNAPPCDQASLQTSVQVCMCWT